jgi:hypothetical protein
MLALTLSPVNVFFPGGIFSAFHGKTIRKKIIFCCFLKACDIATEMLPEGLSLTAIIDNATILPEI